MHSPTAAPVPDFLAGLHVDRDGRPAPVTVVRRPGKVMFKALCEHRKLACATYRLCGLCGDAFTDTDWCWTPLPGGEPLFGPADDWFTEIPVHGACLAYALAACPHMVNESAGMVVHGWQGPWTRVRMLESDHMFGAPGTVAMSTAVGFDSAPVTVTAARFAGTEHATQAPTAATSPVAAMTAALRSDLDEQTFSWAAIVSGAIRYPGVADFVTGLDAQGRATLLELAGSHPTNWPVIGPGGELAARAHGVPAASAHVTRRSELGRVGRNDPCPCGSGAKAKRCHSEHC